MNFKDIKAKAYPDGKEGDYLCTCTNCKGVFIGHKRDFSCGRCSQPCMDINIKYEYMTLEDGSGWYRMEDIKKGVWTDWERVV